MSGGSGYNNPSMRKKTRGSNVGPRRGGYRTVPDKSILQEGIYVNEPFLHMFASLVGYTGQIKVRNGRVYEGILRTSSPKFEVVLECAHIVDQPVDGKAPSVPSRDQIIPSIIFNRSDIVTLTLTDVNLDYAVMDGFTDGAISGKCNGQGREKELQPWTSDLSADDDGFEGIEDSKVDYSLDNEKGWDPNEMFATNSKKFNIKSDYDPSLSQYTTPLNKSDTAEYRQREEQAAQLAREIERNLDHGAREILENGENEEMAFSAVQRPTDAGSQRNLSPSSSQSMIPSGNGSVKYVAPHMRSSQPTNASSTPAQRPQHLVQSTPPVSAAGTAVSKPPMDTVLESGAVEARVNGADEHVATSADIINPTSQHLHQQQPSSEQHERRENTAPNQHQITPSPASKGNIPKGGGHVFEELKQFQSNFKLSDREPLAGVNPNSSVSASVSNSAGDGTVSQSPAVPTSHATLEHGHHVEKPPHQQAAVVDQQEPAVDVLKKSVLNPNAKEFNPTAKAAPPRVMPSSTPPRPLSVPPSPVSSYPMQIAASQMPPMPMYQSQPVFVPVQQQQQQQQQQAQGSRYQQVSQPNKRVTVSARGTSELNQTPQAAIMAGAPLITQPVMQLGQPNMFQPQFFPLHASPAAGYPPFQVPVQLMMRPTLVQMGQHDPGSMPQIVAASSQPGGGVFLSQPVVHIAHPSMQAHVATAAGGSQMTSSQHSQQPGGVPHPPVSGHQTPTPSQLQQQYPMQQVGVLPPSASGTPQAGPPHGNATYHPLAQHHQMQQQHQMVVQQQNMGGGQSMQAPQSPQVAYTSVPLHYSPHPGVMAYVPASQNAQLQQQQAHTLSVASMSQQSGSGGGTTTVQMTPVHNPPPTHLMMTAQQQPGGGASQHPMHGQPMQGGPAMIIPGQQQGGPGGVGGGPPGTHQYVQAHQIQGAGGMGQGHLGMQAGPQHMMGMFVSHHPMHQGPQQNFQHGGPQQ